MNLPAVAVAQNFSKEWIHVSKKKNNALRFYAVDRESGLGSSEWRIWVGAGSTDVYVSPRRLAGDFKLSIHSDGMNQLGFYSPRVRKEIRRGDKHFFHRWRREELSFVDESWGWSALCAVYLDPREFEPINESGIKSVSEEIAVTSNFEGLIAVSVVATDDLESAIDLDDLEGFPVLKSFPKGANGAVTVVAAMIPRISGHLAAVDSDRNGFSWQPPVPAPDESPFGFAFSLGTWPGFSEYSSKKHAPPPLVPNLPAFNGRVRHWSEVPEEYASFDAFCGVLAYGDAGADLYVDPRSHCNHEHLVPDANDLIRSIQTNRMDSQWYKLADGRVSTAILTKATADDEGFKGYLPNPMRDFSEGLS